jgi:hypothetical protein
MAATQDLSGQWSFTVERDPALGISGAAVECAMRQRRSELTLKCEKRSDEIRGELRGRTVLFRLEKTGIPPMVKDVVVATHTGELNESGTRITGVLTIVSSVLDVKLKFVAEKLR